MIEVIKFGASWCQPCSVMKPTMVQIIEKYENDTEVSIMEIDIDEDPELASKYAIRNIPTTVFLKDGNVEIKQSGVLNIGQIDELIKRIK